VAPYLAQADEALVGWIAETLWARPWGLFAVAEADLRAVRKHFRKFLMVQDPEGEAMYFRYYDPRVIKTFLFSCNEEELAEFYGPLSAYGVSEEEPGQVSLFLRTTGS
jgi:hypothetical protein